MFRFNQTTGVSSHKLLTDSYYINALEHAKNLSKATHAELNEKKKWRRAVQKRTLFLATIAMKDDNSDLRMFSNKQYVTYYMLFFSINPKNLLIRKR